jgi:hypothetical protein
MIDAAIDAAAAGNAAINAAEPPPGDRAMVLNNLIN